ncbi:MAG: hypothetical protein AAGK74_18330, partial [Chloroflexota bacterium]
MKHILFVLTLVLLLVVAPLHAQDQTLEIYITGLPESGIEWFRTDAFPAFEEQNPGVQLEIITGGWGDF